MEPQKESNTNSKQEKSAIAKREEETLAFWNANKIFEKSEAKKGKEFVFYDGPPFATGLPHHGHILAGTIKDAIPRYQTMRGRKVSRRWGWDCHGLPLENIIEKELGLKTKKDIETLGIGAFNEAARKAVLRYADDWKRIIPRMGRWADMENAYRTMDATYTESVWWVFKTLYDKGLIYQGFKGMHLCPRCETTLSNFEVAQGYKDISDLVVTVKLELVEEPITFLLAWTTTPWTLPGNMAAAVNSNITYVKVEKDGEQFIVAKDKKEVIGEDVKIIEEFSGKALLGKSYLPPFDYYKNVDIQNKKNAWKVYAADYVTAEDGTGIVHLAPAYGAEDLELAKKEKIPIVHHVGVDGKFKKEITDFRELSAKPKDDHQSGDVAIIKNLASRGLLFAKEKITHSYPHCWRCDTPLLNYASVSWFVNVMKIKDKLIAENKKIKWIPEYLGSGRFHNILETAPDWAISRSRFWGAPLPVWQCAQCESRIVIGSLAELKKHAKSNNNHFVFVRHGESEHNVQSVLNSSEDKEYNLTEKGKKQIAAIAQKLKKRKNVVIYSSPFLRTKESAEIIANTLEINKNSINIDQRIRELNLGDFDGKKFTEFLKYEESSMAHYEAKIPGGESYLDAKKRFGDFLYEINNKYSNSTIVVTTHGIGPETVAAIVEGADRARSKEIINTIDVAPGHVLEFDFVPLPHNLEYELVFHRPYIDEVVFSCDCGGDLRRVPEVFDCWYESGSMPYGQFHYPFDTKKFDPKKKKGYPANFIAEGLDQTRGWFYSMLVLGVALFGKSPYERVIVNGLILAEDGQKMSKKLKNYTDPVLIADKYGADALRYYLLSSPTVRSEDFSFSDKGVDEISKKIIVRLENVLSFYELYATETTAKPEKSKNVLDQWILTRLHELTKEVTESMDTYELDRATRPFLLFVDDLSTWYLRRSRERFKSDDKSDKNFALATTKHVLREVAKLLAPFMPFLAEHLFLRLQEKKDAESVHLEMWPKIEKINENILKQMQDVRALVTRGLEARSKAGIKVRQPLLSLVSESKDIVKTESLKMLVMDEVNVKDVVFQIGASHILDLTITPELKKEGLVRDLIREIQDKRKEAGLSPKDSIRVEIEVSDETIRDFASEIGRSVNAAVVDVKKSPTGDLSVVIKKI